MSWFDEYYGDDLKNGDKIIDTLMLILKQLEKIALSLNTLVERNR